MRNQLLKQTQSVYCYSFLFSIMLMAFPLLGKASASSSQDVNAVQISLKLKNKSIVEVFDAIEAATDYVFAYGQEVKSVKTTFSLSFKKASVGDILEEVGKKADLHFKRINNTISVSLAKTKEKERVLQPMLVVTGKVTDLSANNPLPGVNVVVKGTANGTITDINGEYKINVSNDDDVLIFSFVGYTSEEVPVNGRSRVDVTLAEDIASLNEVVVTALGVEREKKAIGYAITEIEGQEISKSATLSPVLALQGKVAGVDIAPTEGGAFGGSRITIRGNSTLGNNNQPIFVVDGVIVENNTSGGSEWGGADWGNELKNLNSDNFESVTILKGAAATALYGSRALNGAIVIVTKKGRERKGIGVDVSQTINTKRVYDGPAFQNVYGEGAMPGYDNSLPDIYNPSGAFKLNSDGQPFLEGVNGWVPISYGHKMDGSQVIDWDGETINYTPKPDNYLQLYENGLYSNTNVTLNGGTDKSTFIVSSSYTDEKGTFPRNAFDRLSLFSKVTHRLNDVISTQVSANYSRSNSQNPPTNIGQYFITGSWPRNYDTQKWKDNYKASHGGIPSANYNDPAASVPGHGVWFSVYENTAIRLEESLRLTGDVTFRLTDWFDVQVNGYVNNYYTKIEEKQLGQGYSNEGGFYKLEHVRNEQNDVQLWMNFYQDFTPDISARLSVIGEHWTNKETFSRSQTSGGLIVPGQYTIGNSKDRPTTAAGYRGGRELSSVYSFLDLEYKSMLFLQATARNDWSSTLTYSDGSGNNSYFYPSASLSWVFSETWNMPSFLSFGKVRASWAHVGNDFSPYSINPGFNSKGVLQSFNGDIVRYGFNSSRVPNLNLRPEDKKSVELGLDIRLLNDRIGLDFTYYKENTYNQIMSIPVPSESGVGSQLINAGDIQNQGIELALNTTPVVVGDFRWDLNVVFTRNRNKIVELYPGVTEFNLEGNATYGNTRVATMAYVGEEYGVLVSDSKPKVFMSENDPSDPRNGMNILTWHDAQRGAYTTRSYEKQVVGNMNPDFLAGITSSFSYKGLYASVLFDVKIGGDISTYSGRYGTAYGLFESTLENRDKEHGGFEWTSSWTGNSYDDGYIPEGVFEEGTIVQMKDANGNIIENEVGGLTYQEAYEQGLVEPTHGAYWHWKNNSWGGGVINDAVVQENSYVGIREANIGYTFPRSITDKLRLNSLSIMFFGRDLGFLYKTLNDNLNPFSIRSNRAGSAHEWQQAPYIRTVGGTVKIGI